MTRALSQVRLLAVKVVGEVLGKQKFASQQLDAALRGRSWSSKDRALLTQLVYGVLREKGFIDALLSQRIRFSKTPPFILNLLRLGFYQMFELKKVPDHAVLYESVEIAKKEMGPAMGKLVNAVLRRLQREKEEFLKQREKQLHSPLPTSFSELDSEQWAAALSMPTWLLARWAKREGPEQAVALAQCFQKPPGLFLRVNPLKAKAEAIVRRVRKAQVLDGGAFLQVYSLQGEAFQGALRNGLVSVQDRGSYQIVQKLHPQKNEVGLDACAGHGGKTSAIAEQLKNQGKLWVHEINYKKINELENNFKRLNLSYPKVLQTPEQAKEQGLSFDWILVDAPCSGLGTLGRKPEIRWRVRSKDLKKYGRQQRGILATWCDFVKVGGRLLYSVCSFEPEESSKVVESFLQNHDNWVLKRSGVLSPLEEKRDGFYWADLRRTA